MACCYNSGDVRVTVCCSQTRFGMFGNGIVHDAVFHCQSVYSAILGFRCGRDVRLMWSLPLISSIAFLAGTLLFFDIREVWFIIYAATYLAIGWMAMGINRYLKSKR